MRTAGIFPGNANVALALTRKGQQGQASRYAYAKALTELQATAAVNKALGSKYLNPGQAPYVGLVPGFAGLGDDVYFGPAIDPLTGERDQSQVDLAIADTFKTIENPSMSTPSTGSSSTSSDWSSVFSTFFANVGKGLGMRISGQPAQVPLATKGPSMTTVIGLGALVAIPLLYLAAKKG